MPIFTQSLQRIDASNPQDAIKKMANHIKYIQEELEHTLYNLDSRNINEIDLKETTIKDTMGSTDIGSFLYYKGKDGQSFAAGTDNDNKFVLEVKGKDGKQTMYLNSSGELIITEHTSLTVDGGQW